MELGWLIALLITVPILLWFGRHLSVRRRTSGGAGGIGDMGGLDGGTGGIGGMGGSDFGRGDDDEE